MSFSSSQVSAGHVSHSWPELGISSDDDVDGVAVDGMRSSEDDHHLLRSSSSPPSSSSGVWSSLFHQTRIPRKPMRAISSPHTPEQVRASIREDILVPWSVVAVELVVTVVLVSFGVISFWRGTWSLISLALGAAFPSSPQYSIAVSLGAGAAALVIGQVWSRAVLERRIYLRLKPRTWSEVVKRTFADRTARYVEAWAGIAIWKGVWDIWDVYVLPGQPWASAVVAHVAGLLLLLLLFAFRSAVTPPMVFVEDTIMLSATVTRWNLLSKLIVERKQRRGMTQKEMEWEDFSVPL